eukprot:TRINITY_DN6993_c0_g1_i7.p1 TRINITY_DN6993_c0_g1~~TRINITY_DN6993_c0_g1_i7.p1  ORF type:complete len:283 (+),score=28.25 TRINITY_DN6993_c0_g1_i7:47-895(+)
MDSEGTSRRLNERLNSVDHVFDEVKKQASTMCHQETQAERDREKLVEELKKGLDVKLPFPGCLITIHHLTRRPKDIINDLLAGITVTALLIPQSMAYAILSHVPLQYGLYSGMFSLLVYPILGTSRHAGFGPTSPCSIMMGNIVDKYATTDEEKAEVAICITLIVGVVSVLLGLFQMGFLENLLSKSLIGGFLSAVALQVIVDQLLKCVQVPGSGSFLEKLHALLGSIGDYNGMAIGLSALALAMLMIMTWAKERFFPKSLLLQCATPVSYTHLTLPTIYSV